MLNNRGLTLLIICLAAINCAYGQDVISKQSGEEVIARIIEISGVDVTYKRWDNLEGPNYTLPQSEIISITYQNGTKDIFEVKATPAAQDYVQEPEKAPAEQEQVPMADKDDHYFAGQADANKYYRSYKGAGTGVLVTSLLSPIVGLVPAIGCSATRPKDINLNYPNTTLMQNPDYRNGYKLRARQIKNGKVWKNWGIAFGVNLALAFILYSR